MKKKNKSLIPSKLNVDVTFPFPGSNNTIILPNLWVIFFSHYLRFSEISTKISAESSLYREVPSYRLSSCTHLILTSQSYRNHNKSNSTIYSRT